MELRQLTYFKAIVEQGSINAAARSLHMSNTTMAYCGYLNNRGLNSNYT